MDSFYMIQKLIIIHSKHSHIKLIYSYYKAKNAKNKVPNANFTKHSHIKLIYSYYKAKNAKNKVPNANFIKSVAKSAAQC